MTSQPDQRGNAASPADLVPGVASAAAPWRDGSLYGAPRSRYGSETHRRHIAGFASFGATLVLCGVVSVLVGVPARARDLAPVGGLGNVASRVGELSLPLSAIAAAIVVLLVATLAGTGRLRLFAAAVELAVLGLAIEASLVGAAGRMSYASDGSVLLAMVAAMTGGVAVLGAALLAWVGRYDDPGSWR